jgi:23S rRNA (adenine2503-C2)-methyltransferase
MTQKIYALDLSSDEWVSWLAEELKQPKFRADQICQWLWQKRVFDIEEMTNLSKSLRDTLAERVNFELPLLIKEQRSNIDGTRKYMWRMQDGNSVESVLLKQEERLTACVSTQVGCPLQCTFCATGLSGYVRNLTAGEIAGQFLVMEKTLGREINNIVYMGMGEPLLNTEEVFKSVRMLNNPKMRNLGIRHITISTAGIIPGIKALADSGLGVRLAVSLHAADGALRSALMPINQTYPVEELRKAMQEYQKITGNRITIEYALFGGVNDSVEHARELVRYLKGIHVFINLIPFNAVDGRYEKPKPENIMKFRTILETAGFEAEIRQEHGADIDAACGQLRRKTVSDEPLMPEPKKRAVNKDYPERDLVSKPSESERRGARVSRAPDKAGRTVRVDKKTKASGGFIDERRSKRAAAGTSGKAANPEAAGRGAGSLKAGVKHQHPHSEEQQEKLADRDKKYKSRYEKMAGVNKAAARDNKPGSAGKAEPERYRSGKIKEERPSYRGQGEGYQGSRDVKYRPRADKQADDLDENKGGNRYHSMKTPASKGKSTGQRKDVKTRGYTKTTAGRAETSGTGRRKKAAKPAQKREKSRNTGK